MSHQICSSRTVEQLLSQANALHAKFVQGGERLYIDEAIDLDREALALCTASHPERSTCSFQLSLHLTDRYNKFEREEDLEEVTLLHREALSLRPPGHSHRSVSLNNLANVTLLDREVLSLRPPGHPDQLLSLTNLADDLRFRYNELGRVEDLEEAILLDREALSLRPPGHLQRSLSLNSLADDLRTRYNILGKVEDIEEATLLDREVLSLRPPGHPDRSSSLSSLGIDLWFWYSILGRVGDLEEATVLDREALSLRPPGHPHRSLSLNNLASNLWSRFNRLGRVEDLEEATLLNREALSLRPPGHLNRSLSLTNLATNLRSWYKILGRAEDLEEATLLHREALLLQPPGHPDRSLSLSNLAVDLRTRYNMLGRVEDFEEATLLERRALSLRPPGHPYRSSSLTNLANDLGTRYNMLGKVEDIEEATLLHREALSLQPPGHPDRSWSLNSLAIDLWSRYNMLGRVEDLEEATLLDREALSLRPPGHLNRSLSLNSLAVDLRTRYNKLGKVEDLEEATLLHREVLSLRPPGHPDRSLSLMNLAIDLSAQYKPSGYLHDPEKIFCLYVELACLTDTVSLHDLSAAKQWSEMAEEFDHPTILFAYETTLRLLVLNLAALPALPQHLSLLRSLTSSLATDAFSACLRNHSPAKAVELLEQGRGVFWNQLSRFRPLIDDVIASGPAGQILAKEFSHLTSTIRSAFHPPNVADHDSLYQLSLKLQRVVSNIRKLPGLSCFLLPSPFCDLRCAASGGPVIIMNASKYSCDALVISVNNDPVHIPLSITKEDVQKLSSKLHILTVRAKTLDVAREFAVFLRGLWDNVVSPIANVLRETYPVNSRVWWCPTSEFSLLPLHAASPYRKNQQSFADLYVSSYTPTLTALIRARQPSSSSGSESKRFIAIGQAIADGTEELLSVGTELASISQCVNGRASFACIEGQESCISRVIEELGKNEWVHLACHGVPNREQPFESAFALYDGPLTIHRLLGCELKNPEFAYLSACHTTVGDKKSPDEVIHLASAIHFAGFRSVIGTMWAVDDAETNKIAPLFYKYMVDASGRLDYTLAAYALRQTMWLVKDMPVDQRSLYIHIGV